VAKYAYLYAEKESPKYERATMKFLRRYLDEKGPTLKTSRRSSESLSNTSFREGRAAHDDPTFRMRWWNERLMLSAGQPSAAVLVPIRKVWQSAMRLW